MNTFFSALMVLGSIISMGNVQAVEAPRSTSSVASPRTSVGVIATNILGAVPGHLLFACRKIDHWGLPAYIGVGALGGIAASVGMRVLIPGPTVSAMGGAIFGVGVYNSRKLLKHLYHLVQQAYATGRTEDVLQKIKLTPTIWVQTVTADEIARLITLLERVQQHAGNDVAARKALLERLIRGMENDKKSGDETKGDDSDYVAVSAQ